MNYINAEGRAFGLLSAEDQKYIREHNKAEYYQDGQWIVMTPTAPHDPSKTYAWRAPAPEHTTIKAERLPDPECDGLEDLTDWTYMGSMPLDDGRSGMDTLSRKPTPEEQVPEALGDDTTDWMRLKDCVNFLLACERERRGL